MTNKKLFWKLENLNKELKMVTHKYQKLEEELKKLKITHSTSIKTILPDFTPVEVVARNENKEITKEMTIIEWLNLDKIAKWNYLAYQKNYR